jgi:hypothetical protein
MEHIEIKAIIRPVSRIALGTATLYGKLAKASLRERRAAAQIS